MHVNRLLCDNANEYILSTGSTKNMCQCTSNKCYHNKDQWYTGVIVAYKNLFRV